MRLNNTISIPPRILERHHILSLVASKYLTVKQASQELNLSLSHTKRLWRTYRDSQGNILQLLPKSRNKPVTVLTKPVKQAIIKLYEQYPDCSCYHLTDKVHEQGITISRETVRKVINSVKKDPRQRKGSRTKPSTRFEAENFGQIIQMDTCQGAWLEGSGYQYLIACLDDHSRFVLEAAIYSTDSTWTNMCVIRQMIEHWGLPGILYTDNASHFKIVRPEQIQPWQHPERYQTRIQSCLAQLGITHITHHPFNPRAKGKIERFFRFAQARLLRHNTARNLAELNYQLHQWLKWYNYEHVNGTTKQKPCERLSPSVFKPIPPELNLDEIFVVKERRKVRKDNSISFRGKLYFIPEKHHVAGLTVDVYITDQQIAIYSNGKFLMKFVIDY